MPWSHTSPMDQKTQFIADYLRDRLSVTELCELYGVGIPPGVPRSCWRSCADVIPADLGLPARPSVTSSAATAWCPRRAGAASSGILANLPAPLMHRTICGVRTSKGTSRPVTGSPAIR
jgi:hypothetical protein